MFWAFFGWLGGLGAYGPRSFALVIAADSTIKKIAWSKLIRRTQMYLALFLTLWVVEYALSSFIFNHHALFSGWKPLAQFEEVDELPYEAVFFDGVEPREAGLHLKHGTGHPGIAANLWGVVFDLVIVGMLFWVLSGDWMWLEIKPARFWSGVSTLVGIGLFLLLMFTV